MNESTICWCLISVWILSTVYGSSLPSRRLVMESQQRSSDGMQFDLADLEVQYQLDGGGTALLQAYKVSDRWSTTTMTMTDGDRPTWVSAGCPMLTSNSRGQSIQLDPEGVTVFVKLLDEPQKRALLAKAVAKYGLSSDISADDVIRPLPLWQFSCLLEFFQDGAEYSAHGSVTDFNKTPLKLTFPMHKGSKRRTALEQRLRLRVGLTLKCELASNGRQERVGFLVISSARLQKLNRSPDERFVTRKQLLLLSNEIAHDTHMVENYDSGVEEFGEWFIQEVVKISSGFQRTSFDQALRGLSVYGTSFSRADLQSIDRLRRQFGRQFVVLEFVDNKRLLTANDQYQSIDNDSVANAVFGMFGGDEDQQFVRANRDEWLSWNLTVDQQLQQLNRRLGAGIYWIYDHGLVRPETLSVMSIGPGTTSQNITMTRIRRKLTNARYFKSYDLELDPSSTPTVDVDDHSEIDNSLDEISGRIDVRNSYAN